MQYKGNSLQEALQSIIQIQITIYFASIEVITLTSYFANLLFPFVSNFRSMNHGLNCLP